jgi:hypothetical protein
MAVYRPSSLLGFGVSAGVLGGTTEVGEPAGVTGWYGAVG